MKYVKILGLAAVVAAALMAFVGASTASASMGVLCKNNTTQEMCSEPYGAGTIIEATNTGGTVLKALNSTVDTCKDSSVKGEIEKTGSTTETASGPILSLLWKECTCTTTTAKNGRLSIEHSPGSSNGVLWGSGTEVTLEGCLGLHCIYGTGTGTKLGTVTGGNPATFTANATIARTGGRSGAFCPTSGEWTTENSSTYEITAPKPAFISTGDTSS